MNKIISFIIRNYLKLFIVLFWFAGLVGFLMIPYFVKSMKDERSLSVYTWADKIDESVLLQFEKDTGIKVYVNYYESNEELLTKLEMSKSPDCDIILPSGYMVESLIKSGLIKKIDKSKCDFLDRIYPEFMGFYFDKKNEYSLPLYWDFIGIGFTHSYFPEGLPENSWDMIFNEKSIPCKKISMIDDARESIFLASKYFEWNYSNFSIKQLEALNRLFIRQKKWVGAYTDTQQGYYLTSHTYPVVVAQREIIVRDKMINDDIGFIVPEEGTLLVVENIVITTACQKDDLVYELINYLYRYDILSFHSEEFCILPTVKDVLEDMPEECIGIENIKPGEQLFPLFNLFPNVLTQKQMNDLWIGFKAS